MDFTFLSAPKVVFKSGLVNEIGPHVTGFGNKFLVVTDKVFKASGVLNKLDAQLGELGIKAVYFMDLTGEPEVEDYDNATDLARAEKCDTVLSIGGGSLLDVGKAVAALITNPGKVQDYLEYVGKGYKIESPPVPFLAMPTTSGTGSEVTKLSVVGSKKQNFKRSMRHDSMMAKTVIMDPSLTTGLPKKVTATSGIDAMTHNMEAFVTVKNPTPLTRAIALQGLTLAGKYLKRAYDTPDDLEAREGMALSSLCGGLSFSNSGLGAAHGLGMTLNVNYPMTHGEGVGITLPYVMEINAEHFPGLYDVAGEALTGKRFDRRGDGTKAAIEFIKELNAGIGLPSDLKSLDITDDMAKKLGESCYGSSMSGNPIQLEADKWTAVFNRLR